jgi:hypothetical protein
LKNVMGNVTFQLTANERAEIDKAANGQGGYQTLILELQRSITTANSLTIDDEQLGRVVRMCAYGSGGFQRRLRTAFRNHIRALVSW